MPVLHKDGQAIQVDDLAQVERALADGWQLPPGEAGVVVERPGAGVSEVSPELLPYVLGGAQPASDTSRLAAGIEAQREVNYDNPVGAALLGAGSVATFGVTDWLARGAGVPVHEISAYNPKARAAGEIAATAALIASPFGKGKVAQGLLKYTPAGQAVKFGLRGETALARVGHAVGEGAAFGLGQAVSEIAIREPGVVAESALVELGHGALLGAALGGTVGALGEGVGAVARRVRSKPDPFDLSTGPAKQSLDELASAHKEIDDALDHAYTSKVADVDAARGALNADWSAKMRQNVEEVYANAVKPRQYLDDALNKALDMTRAEVAAGNVSLEKLTQLSEHLNAASRALGKGSKVGPARLGGLRKKLETGKDVSKDVARLLGDVDDVLSGSVAGQTDEVAEKLMAKYRASGDDMDGMNVLFHARDAGNPGAREWVDEIIQRAKAEANAIEESVAALQPAAFDKGQARKIMHVLDAEKIGPESFARIMRLPPPQMIAKAKELGDYYTAAAQAVKGNAVAEARLAEALARQKAAIDALVPAEVRQLLTPETVGAILAMEVVPEFDGPADEIVKAAVAMKLLGGMKGMRLRQRRSLGKRIAASIGRRAMAGAASGMARSTNFVRGLGPAAGTAVVGGSASAGYETFNMLERWFSKFASHGAQRAGGDMAYREALTAAVNSERTAAGLLDDAVERLATGKPRTSAAVPAVGQVIDLLTGDAASKKTTPEKFKVIQENLSRYITAPDAVLGSVYELLKPLQQVSEQLADMAETIFGVQLDYLFQKMPKDPGNNVKLGVSRWTPSDRELYEFGLCALGVVKPLEVVGMVADGFVPPQAVHALAQANPEIFNGLRQRVMERADEIRENATYNQLIALGLAFQAPLDPTTEPRYVAFMQEQHAEQDLAAASAPASGGGKSAKDEYSDAQQLLA